MDKKITLLIAGSILVLVIFFGISFHDRRAPTGTNSIHDTDPLPPIGVEPVLPTSPPSPTETHSALDSGGVTIVSARIDSVNTSELRIGKPSVAYVTITNTEEVPIVKERIQITAGKNLDFSLSTNQDRSYKTSIIKSSQDNRRSSPNKFPYLLTRDPYS